MAKYLSNRQRLLKVGISSFTENNTVLQVTGKVGIGTTNAQGYQLYSIGDVKGNVFHGSAAGLRDITEGNAYYVSVDGSDTNYGDTISSPFATLKQALSVAQANDIIRIGTGTFTEIFPLTVPQGVSIKGSGIRATFIQPTVGTKQNDCFLLNGETSVEDLTVGNFYEPGYAFKFANNAKTTTRSPYIQRVTVLNKGSVTSGLDPFGFDTAHNPGGGTYKSGRGVLIDASVVNPGTLEPAILFNECTFITPNNTALEMTNGARTEWVNCFTYFADKSIHAYDGPVGFASTGYVRIKTSNFSGTTPANNDEIYYLESNPVSATYSQVGTALTITKVGHGLTIGDRIYSDFTSGIATDGFYRVTGYVGINTFSITMVGSATTSGSVSYKKALGFGTVRSYDSSAGLTSIRGKGEGLFELPSTRIGKTVTPYGGSALSISQEKFGTSSLLLDGTGDYVRCEGGTDFTFSGNFTAECWVYPTSVTGSRHLFALGTETTGRYHFSLEGGVVTGNFYGQASTTFGGSISINTWTHIALVRSGSTITAYVNGTALGTTETNSSSINNTGQLTIGADNNGINAFAGYIDEVRISNIARYTGTFVTATSQFNSDGFDKLLLHFDGVTGSTSFIDSSIPTQDVRWVRNGVGIATANRITLADYQQFGAEMRSIGSAAVFGNTGVTANGPGSTLRLFAFNFGHIGSGKDFSQDVSLVNQENEVITINNGKVYFVTIDQSGDFRVGDAFYVNQELGTVNFGGQDFTINSLSDLNVTDGTNTTTITPTTITVGGIQLTGNEITSTSGDITINPSGINSTTVSGNLNVTDILNSPFANIDDLNTKTLNVSGISSFTSISAGGTTGQSQYVLTSTGIGITWQAVSAIEGIAGVNIGLANYSELNPVTFSRISTGTTSTLFLDQNLKFVYNTSLGNLGIGTTNPTSRLHVLGDTLIAGVSTLGITTFTGNVSFGTSAFFGDGDKLYFGDGNDLQIEHDGSHSYIRDAGTGNLYLESNGGGVVITKPGPENIARFLTDGAVELYFDNSKEFETTGYGATVFGVLQTQGLNVISGVGTIPSFVSTNATITNINSSGISTLGITSTTNLTTQTLNVSGLSTFNNTINIASGIITSTGSNGVGIGSYLRLKPHLNEGGEIAFDYASGIIGYYVDVDGGNQFRFANYDTNGTFKFITNSTEKVRISNSGNVGIGSISPTEKLDVVGNIKLTGQIHGPSELIIDPSAVGNNTGAVRIKGDLYVDGSQFIVNSTTIELADFIVGIATTATSDLLADGAGIRIGPDNTLLYNYNGGTTPSLKSSENFDLASGKSYFINGTQVLSSTTLGSGVTNSSLTSIGTLTQLSVSGVSTLGRVQISSGIVTASTGIVTYYGDAQYLTKLTGASQNVYGSETTIPIITVDSTGRITSIGSSGVNFTASTVFQSDKARTISTDTNAVHYITFVNSNNLTGDYEYFYTDPGIIFNPSTNNLGINTTNPTSSLHVSGNVLISGVTTSTDFNSASDINLKENIKVIEDPIDKVLQLNGVTFDWKETGKSSMGVIAQEVEKVLPELVNGTESKTVNYNGLIGLLIEVVKSQQNEINILKNRLK